MADNNSNLFQRLTGLFRSGPVVKRKVRSYQAPTASTAMETFRRARSDVYNSTLSAYGAFDRMSRYSDFSEMEATPELASALDIYAEETVSTDERGRTLHIYSDNAKIRELLHDLFYDTLNVEFNLTLWVRNLCKYGDFFLFLDVSPEYGIQNAFPIPISEIEREEGFDQEDPFSVRFRWITQGNQTLENWQVAHMRLLGNDAFLPYGSSVLESARRIWRQLILIEDAMLVYRVIRAPERRVFYIDVGNVPPEDVANYLEQAQSSLKRNTVVNKTTGQVDLRYNPLSVDEDYFLPVRGGESGTRIDTLAGGQNTAAIEDVEYIQKKLFAAIKIPRAYLGYDEEIGSKATLAQEDIRFSRSIQKIQKTVIAELNKIAMVHLYSHGYTGEDLLDFNLQLSNPSSVAQQQKLELIRARFEIAGSAPEGVVDREWIRRNVMGLTTDEITTIEEGKKVDKLSDLELESVTIEEPPGEESSPEDAEAGEEPADEEEADEDNLFAADIKGGKKSLLTSNDDENDEDQIPSLSIDDDEAPAKAEKQIRNAFNEPLKVRRTTKAGASKTHMPNFVSMTSVGKSTRNQDSMNKPFGGIAKNPFGESNLNRNASKNNTYDNYLNDSMKAHARMTSELDSTLRSLGTKIASKPRLINEEAILNDEKEKTDD